MMVSITFKERYGLLNRFLPQQGSFDELVISEDVSKKIDFSQEEIKDLDIKTETIGDKIFTKWDPEKTENHKIEVDLLELEFNLIKRKLKEKSDKNELSKDFLDLYRKFNTEFKKEEVAA